MKKVPNNSVLTLAYALILNINATQLNAKQVLHKQSTNDSKIKEYVIVATEPNTVITKLGELFDRLKVFANQPKNLKDLQEQADKLEDSLRKNVAQIKDCHYVIARIKTETAKLKNEIPTQQNNQKAKEVFDKIVDFWNNAEGELEKISNYSKNFDKITEDINAKNQEINKVLETGNQEIEAIKAELNKIAAIEEELARRQEHELTDKINKNFSIKKSNNPEESMSPATTTEQASTSAATTQTVDTERIADKITTLSFFDSLNVLGVIAVNFVKIAYVGAKDIFTRLFLTESTIKLDSPTTAVANPPSNALAVSTATSPTKEATAANAEQYQQDFTEALAGLKTSLISIFYNGTAYLGQKYTEMMATTQKSQDVIEEKSTAAATTAVEKPEEQKPDELEIKAAAAKTESTTKAPGTENSTSSENKTSLSDLPKTAPTESDKTKTPTEASKDTTSPIETTTPAPSTKRARLKMNMKK